MNEVIQYDQLVGFLKHASLFEVYRLSAAIRNELADPARIAQVKKQFKVGDTIEYFDAKTNQFIAATVLKKNTKYVIVKNCDDGKKWELCYHLLNINSRPFEFNNAAPGLSRNEVKVGDLVAFNHRGEEIVGEIERLNQKTVSLKTAEGQGWRVYYKSLNPIIEGENHHPRMLDHQP